MNKALLLIIIIFCSISCFGQKILLDSIAYVDLPKHAAKILTQEQGVVLMTNVFKAKPERYKAFFTIQPRYSYHTGNVFIWFNTHNGGVADGSLLQLKKGLEQLYSFDNTYISTLKKANNNDVLIQNVSIDDLHYYYFWDYNSSNTKGVVGKIAFSNKNVKKAMHILNHILNSVDFTNKSVNAPPAQ